MTLYEAYLISTDWNINASEGAALVLFFLICVYTVISFLDLIFQK
jgi:hypothetical protein